MLVEMQTRFFVLIAVGNELGDQMYRKIDGTAMVRMLVSCLRKENVPSKIDFAGSNSWVADVPASMKIVVVGVLRNI
jgi:hypothetical protein